MALKWLLEQKLEENSENMRKLSYNSLKLQPYLTLEEISTRDKQLLYKFRTQMIRVNHNFGKKTLCPLCQKNDDTQEHLFLCEEITRNESSNSFNYEFIFSSSKTENIEAAAIGKKYFRKREKILIAQQSAQR